RGGPQPHQAWSAHCCTAGSVDTAWRPAEGSGGVRMAVVVEAVHRSAAHDLTKLEQPSITPLTGLGGEGDAHMGATVKHRSRVARDHSQPNLRQVHLIHGELLDELRAGGFSVKAGEMGENITTRGLDLLMLPAGSRLYLGPDAIVEITGLRNPCKQLDGLQ